MVLSLYNTLSRTVEPFEPILPGRAGMYACGPTVYNFAHIGNLRTYVFEDVLRRVLTRAGLEVVHVMNITDVGHLTDDADFGEDKMLRSAREKGMSVWEIARMYTDAFFSDTDKLNILRPSVVCKATDHIEDMIGLVRRLEERGFTYSAGGNVYFGIDRFPDYGRLARLNMEDLNVGVRVGRDPNKKNPHDFVLWFTKSKFENQTMLWDSPWGRGYPGWHLECSSMSMRYLGERIDIHCGGVDHVSVHHTNEIAQSEAATGHKWVNYWIHGEFLLMDRGKMSKSSGGFLTLAGVEEAGFDPLDYRYFCLSGHYRTQLQFSFDALSAARAARKNLMDRIRLLAAETQTNGDKSAEAGDHIVEFLSHAGEDLNMPRCLADAWNLVKDPAVGPGAKLAALAAMDEVLGLRLLEGAAVRDLASDVEALIAERNSARAKRDYARSDEIRGLLLNRGIQLEDTAAGTRWRPL